MPLRELESEDSGFPLTEAAETRLSLYMMTCHALVQRLAHLRETATARTIRDPNYLFNILSQFNQEIVTFFRASSRPPAETRQLLLQRLNMVQLQMEQDDAHLGRIMADVIVDIEAASVDLQQEAYRPYFDILHTQARAFARAFYGGAQCESPETYARGGKCRLEHTFKLARTANPMSCVASDLQIFVFFSFEHRFDDYLAYLFLFLHEYTAHIYARDNRRNVLFNDGWLLWAAQQFLLESLYADSGLPPYAYTCSYPDCSAKVVAPPISSLDVEQADVEGYVRECLKDRPELRMFEFAQHFHAYLNDPVCFCRITHELAWFQHRSGESPKWVTWFLTYLKHEFTAGDKSKLCQVVRQANDVREIMLYLQACPSVQRASRAFPGA